MSVAATDNIAWRNQRKLTQSFSSLSMNGLPSSAINQTQGCDPDALLRNAILNVYISVMETHQIAHIEYDLKARTIVPM